MYILCISTLDPRHPPAANLLPRHKGYTQQSQGKDILASWGFPSWGYPKLAGWVYKGKSNPNMDDFGLPP